MSITTDTALTAFGKTYTVICITAPQFRKPTRYSARQIREFIEAEGDVRTVLADLDGAPATPTAYVAPTLARAQLSRLDSGRLKHINVTGAHWRGTTYGVFTARYMLENIETLRELSRE